MQLIKYALLTLFILPFSFSATVSAQKADKLQLPSDLTAQEATSILRAAEQLAEKEGILINIAIVDAGANLKSFLRMDGSYLGSIDVAIKKARTARLFNGPTGAIGEIAQPGGAIYNIEHSNDGLITFPGGVLVRNADGVIIGAIGISGGTIEQDHHIASEAAKAIL